MNADRRPAKKVNVTGKTARRIRTSDKPARRPRPEDVAAALGADPKPVAVAPSLDPLSLALLGGELARRSRKGKSK